MVFEGIIYGKTIKLRSVEVRDAESTLAMRMDVESQKYMSKVEGSLSQQKSFIERQREMEGDFLFIAEDYSDRPIGMRRINSISDDRTECRTGSLIGIGNAAQNMELTLLGYDFAFQVIGVKRIILEVHENNINVISNQQKLGATKLYTKYRDGFDANFIYQELKKETYLNNRRNVYELIERFS